MDSFSTRILDIDIENARTKKMYKSLEKRLISAVIQKEAADKEKLQKQAALAYEKSQMEKLVQESKKLKQQSMENLKLEKFLINRGHVVNMLKEEVSCKCQDVNMLKEELEDYQDESKISLTKDYLSPIIQKMVQKQNCKCYKCHNILKGVKGRFVGSKAEMKTKKMCKSWINSSKKKEMKKWILGEITEAVADYEDNIF
ncbi:hypothetical protein L1987_29086 [Smallanthus sonchifolius]|uniref:Uncharacterized protein n=1 Tax=Smallanthus sonchifolius TaxID=185202 RepID=A0ACB9I079_9ASTR|nr:hypothetical protein L1987_29086 [Smallanthus sonchifolius]